MCVSGLDVSAHGGCLKPKIYRWSVRWFRSSSLVLMRAPVVLVKIPENFFPQIREVGVTHLHQTGFRPRGALYRQGEGGFTLIELMIVVVLVAIILSFGVPSFNTVIRNNRIVAATNDFSTALSLARTTAIKQGTGAVIQAASGSPSTNEWGQGFTVSEWDDADDDGVVDSGEVVTSVRVFDAFESDVTLDSTSSVRTIAFLSTGLLNSGAGLFRLCDGRTGETGREFTLSATGAFELNRGYVCP